MTDYANETRAQALSRLFELSGRASKEKIFAYTGELKKFHDHIVSEAVTLVLRKWDRQGVPPVGVIYSECLSVRNAKAPTSGFRGELPRRMSKHDMELCRLVKELYRAGCAWCPVTGAWVAYGEEQDDPPHGALAMTLENAQQALGALDGGYLVGNQRIRDWWAAGAPIGKDFPEITR